MFGELAKMMKVAAQVKAKMPEVRARIEAGRHTAEAGEGLVRATVNGKGALTDLRIEAGALGALAAAQPAWNAAALAEMVKAAVAAAQEKAAQAAREAMAELTGGVELAGLNDMLGL